MVPSPILLLASLLGAPTMQTGSQPSVAVYPLTGINLDSSAAQLMTEALSTEVMRTGLTRMLERPQIRAILTEQGFIQSEGCSSNECAVQIGRFLGVDRMIVGSIGSIDSISVINARLVDVSTGEVLSVSSHSASGGASAFLGAGIRQVAQELFDDRIVARTDRSKPQADRKPMPAPGVTDSVTPASWSYAIPDLQIGTECMGFATQEPGYHDLAFGARLRIWWQLPWRSLSIGGGGWYADNFVRHFDAFAWGSRDFGIHVYGASIGLRKAFPITRRITSALLAEQSVGRFIFDSESPSNNDPYGYVTPVDRSDRWESLTWIGMQLAYSPSRSLPLSFSLAYGPGLLSSGLAHRVELACNYSLHEP